MGDELEVSFQEDAIVVGGVAYALPDPPITTVGQLLAFIEQQVRPRSRLISLLWAALTSAMQPEFEGQKLSAISAKKRKIVSLSVRPRPASTRSL